ncbi:hypothetical protein CSOJ01_03859 [Colletotrichum sojae]|uniref:C2H2-type domain-containing protein n=1 Tax=Colletotrichum sojae TaxID=2175907 RepID=A0A8H6N0B2_9PEZI|nr:hypothetical protein CSOJ01_03859 [Colletotrichum sojae]
MLRLGHEDVSSAKKQGSGPDVLPVKLTPITGRVSPAKKGMKPWHGNSYSPPLRIALPSVTSSQQTEEWDISQLRGWLRDILDKKPTTDEAVDQIVSLLTQFEVPWSEDATGKKGEREEATGKNLIMQRFLSKKPGSSSILTSADSGFGSRDSCLGSLGPVPPQIQSLLDPYRSPTDSDQYLLQTRRGPQSFGTALDTFENVQASFDVPWWPTLLEAAPAAPPILDVGWPQLSPPPEQPPFFSTRADTGLLILTDGREAAAREMFPTDSDDDQSISESSSPQSSQLTEDGFYSIVLSNEQIRRVNDGLLRIFGQLIHSRLGLRTAQHESGSTSGVAASSGVGFNSMSSGNDANNGTGHKRRWHQGGDDDDRTSGDGPGDDGPNSKRRKEDSASKPKIACPFMKRSPASFSTWRTCVGPGFDGLHRMNCQRCHLQFKSNVLLQSHIRAPESCLVREMQKEMGFMTQVQYDDVSRRKDKQTSELQRWREIYMILFPDTGEDSIPSPYFESTEVADNIKAAFDIDDFGAHLGRHLPRRVFARLNEEFQIMSEAARERLVNIVQEEMLDFLKTYVLQEDAAQRPEPTVAGQSTDTTTWNTNVFEGIDLDVGGDLDLSFLGAEDWQSGKGKEPADSAYGSNFMDP